jgi:hypothetical protein
MASVAAAPSAREGGRGRRGRRASAREGGRGRRGRRRVCEREARRGEREARGGEEREREARRGEARRGEREARGGDDETTRRGSEEEGGEGATRWRGNEVRSPRPKPKPSPREMLSSRGVERRGDEATERRVKNGRALKKTSRYKVSHHGQRTKKAAN